MTVEQQKDLNKLTAFVSEFTDFLSENFDELTDLRDTLDLEQVESENLDSR